MIEIIIALSSILVIIIAVVLIRTIRFKPNFEGKSIKEDVYYDKEKAVKSLQEMIKCKTVSNLNPELEDYNEQIMNEERLPEHSGKRPYNFAQSTPHLLKSRRKRHPVSRMAGAQKSPQRK